MIAVLAAILDSGAPAGAAGPVNWFRFGQTHTDVNPFEITITPMNITSVTLDWAAQLGDLVDFLVPGRGEWPRLHRLDRWPTLGVPGRRVRAAAVRHAAVEIHRPGADP